MSERFSLVLPVSRRTPREARDAIASRFGGEPRCGDLLLCISEVVTNAVRHARTAAQLTVSRDRDIVHVELADASPELPVRRSPQPNAPSGRGLRILDQLTIRWGARPTPNGKVVWFELDLAAVTP